MNMISVALLLCAAFGPKDSGSPESPRVIEGEVFSAAVELAGWTDDGGGFTKFVEGCDSVDAESWGYRVNADYHSVAYCERAAAGLLARGGNFLLNVGPDAEGRIPPEAQGILRAFGKLDY